VCFTYIKKTRNIQSIDKIIPLSGKYSTITNKYKDVLALWQGDITILEVDAIGNNVVCSME